MSDEPTPGDAPMPEEAPPEASVSSDIADTAAPDKQVMADRIEVDADSGDVADEPAPSREIAEADTADD